jgi:hypothetical protein
MKKWFAACLAMAAAVLVPGGSIGHASGGGSFSGIDVVRVEMAGSSGTADVNVFGTLKCEFDGGVLLDVTLDQPSTNGTGAGGQNGHVCEAGRTIKWVVTAGGENMMVDDPIKVTADAVVELSPQVETTTETKVLGWGLHAGI